jgi:UDP-N-acetylmuramate dehydrogenase
MFSLKNYNTFKINSTCSNLGHFYNESNLKESLNKYGEDVKVLGGGSNVLLTQDHYESIVINQIKGINITDENDDYCTVEVGAGEQWHHFVMWSVYHNLGGLENMALIPGTVGAAPIQNIGAYGTEQKDCFVSLQATNRRGHFTTVFEKAVCEFGYRDSIFKNQIKDKFIITRVSYRLSKNPVTNSSYKDVTEKLKEKNIENPTVRDIAEAVIEIRKAKLPDPQVIGNAGSFFKNPVISKELYKQILLKNDKVPHYAVDDHHVKVPAAWLIDQCGLKGFRSGEAGTHFNQALVLVNFGKATGKEIVDLSKFIQAKVYHTFEVMIDPEVNIW